MQYIDNDYDLSDSVSNDSDTDLDFNPNRRQSMPSLPVTHIHSNLDNFFYNFILIFL